MVYRHSILYGALSLVFLGIALVLVCLGIALSWSAPARTALFACSLFSFLLTLSYASLQNQEARGFF